MVTYRLIIKNPKVLDCIKSVSCSVARKVEGIHLLDGIEMTGLKYLLETEGFKWDTDYCFERYEY